jgi:hypothetical protein
VLYLEGSTDLAILRAFAAVLNHPAAAALERPFVHYVFNQPSKARDHFRGLREAKPDLVGFVLCDHLTSDLQSTVELKEYMWTRREIENYLCQPETLLAFAVAHERDPDSPLFEAAESARRLEAMEKSIKDNVIPAAFRDRDHRWWSDTKASDDFLDRVFYAYLDHLGLPRSHLKKNDYHILARYVPLELIDDEVRLVLDGIDAVSQQARPIATPQ